MGDLRDPEQTARARSATANFDECLSNLREALADAIKAFAAHHAADGAVTREQWGKWFDGEVPSQDYVDGFNAGVESVILGAETFLDEFNF